MDADIVEGEMTYGNRPRYYITCIRVVRWPQRQDRNILYPRLVYVVYVNIRMHASIENQRDIYLYVGIQRDREYRYLWLSLSLYSLCPQNDKIFRFVTLIIPKHALYPARGNRLILIITHVSLEGNSIRFTLSRSCLDKYSFTFTFTFASPQDRSRSRV